MEEPKKIKVVDETYLKALRHAYNHIDINFLAGVPNEVTLKEFEKWIKEIEDGQR